MAEISTKIAQIKQDLARELEIASTLEALEQVRIKFLSRNGLVAELMGHLKAATPDEKRVLGPQLNELKNWAESAFNQKKYTLENAAQEAELNREKQFDVTAYKYQPIRGGLHVYTKFIRQLADIFISMGYEIVDGPEVVNEYYNFEALNIPGDHPARADHDTFWLAHQPGMLLRTHTSSIQAREMEKRELPLALFAPGRCFRNEATDATHNFMFMQAEGVLIDKNISVANLLATARAFLQAIFETENLEIRVRPGYFPFVEPGLEIDMTCPFCTGKGCSVCKKTGWIEILGSGLIHPNVLRASGIDPEVYSGFAFGMGIERIAMIKYGITDIRNFQSIKMPVLQQWS